jgi:hypothetical protein
LATQTHVQQKARPHVEAPGRLPVGVALARQLPDEPEEVLIADPRGRLTPSQMVDEKLLALLRNGNPGLYLQAAGKSLDIRKIPLDHNVIAPDCRAPDVDSGMRSEEDVERAHEVT